MSFTVKFRSSLWRYAGPGGWHFITLPKGRAQEIRSSTRGIRRGWGSLPVQATIGRTRWRSSIFPDRESNSYLLPVKAEVRRKEQIEDGYRVAVMLEVLI
jgi:hypothetical protein